MVRKILLLTFILSIGPAAAHASYWGELPTSSSAGDFLIFDGTHWSPLVVGTNGQVLTVDTSLSKKIKWATGSGGSAESWSGYFQNCDAGAGSAAWSLNGASWIDFTNIGSAGGCTLVQTENTNFPSVTSYTSGGNKSPGIVFTPNKTGPYHVCSTATLASNITTGTGAVGLFDGSGNIFSGIIGVATTLVPATFCGTVDGTSGVSMTVKLNGRADTGKTTFIQSPPGSLPSGNVFDVSFEIHLVN